MYDLERVRKVYEIVRPVVVDRLKEFKDLWERAPEERLFAELVFCLLTPQSKARTCWDAVERLVSDGFLVDGTEKDVEKRLFGVRFKKNKASYVVLSRRLFSEGGRVSVRSKLSGFSSPYEARRWLVGSVKGMGYKEASHFLRNVGFSSDLAILDRHILRALSSLGVIDGVPPSVTPSMYLKIEERFRAFSAEISIPLGHLDFVFWYMATGDIFK